MKQQKDVRPSKRGITALGSVKALSASALLAAASFVLAYIAKSIFGTGFIRITFECLPIFLGSFLFGPVAGGLIAVTADLLSCLQAGMTPNPVVAVGAVLIGLLSGLIYRYLLSQKHQRLRVAVSVFTAHAIGSMVIKSYGLFLYFGWAVLWRIPIYLGIAAVETVLLILLTENKPLMRQIEKVVKS